MSPPTVLPSRLQPDSVIKTNNNKPEPVGIKPPGWQPCCILATDSQCMGSNEITAKQQHKVYLKLLFIFVTYVLYHCSRNLHTKNEGNSIFIKGALPKKVFRAFFKMAATGSDPGSPNSNLTCLFRSYTMCENLVEIR